MDALPTTRHPSPMLPVVRVVAALLCALFLMACTPHFDWREVHAADAGYGVMYPAKPTQDARDVSLAGEKLPMLMQAARVDKTLYAVGVVTLPRDDAQLRAAVLADLQRGLLANIGQTDAAPSAVAIKQAGNAASVPGVAVQATGQASDKSERFVAARFVARGLHAYQVVILAQTPPPQDVIDQFFDSFTLE